MLFLGSQILIEQSLLPVTIKDWKGCQSHAVTAELCSLKINSNLDVAKSKTLAVPSSEHVTNLADVIEVDRSLIG